MEPAREELRALLAGGLVTEVDPRCDTPEQVGDVIARLRGAPALRDKLVIAGFTLHTIQHEGIDQPCETCMYYLVHRKWCELPELQVPVEPEWSCRLWRI